MRNEVDIERLIDNVVIPGDYNSPNSMFRRTIIFSYMELNQYYWIFLLKTI